MPIVVSTQNTAQTSEKPTPPSSALSSAHGHVRMEQEMMIMRETDQWMMEHYKNRS